MEEMNDYLNSKPTTCQLPHGNQRKRHPMFDSDGARYNKNHVVFNLIAANWQDHEHWSD
jgi:hypothetical protein